MELNETKTYEEGIGGILKWYDAHIQKVENEDITGGDREKKRKALALECILEIITYGRDAEAPPPSPALLYRTIAELIKKYRLDATDGLYLSLELLRHYTTEDKFDTPVSLSRRLRLWKETIRGVLN